MYVFPAEGADGFVLEVGDTLFADGMVHAANYDRSAGAPVVALEADVAFVDVFLESLADAT